MLYKDPGFQISNSACLEQANSLLRLTVYNCKTERTYFPQVCSEAKWHAFFAICLKNEREIIMMILKTAGILVHPSLQPLPLPKRCQPNSLKSLPPQFWQSEALAATVEFISGSLKTSLMRPPSIREELCLAIRRLLKTPNRDSRPYPTNTQTLQIERWTPAVFQGPL